ncbi:hypothetical protein [Ramlibacter rhizophilus]|uniref:Uncharacterized protein n=1 Tax=Ramlibacter rhizophilus TaxID=1781167 RepID=A0A4Z0BMU4_9BURK|nr:hypothetical protein [Ramlibacter rhizophilus]TFY99577.1 hypothetical protein EZ242_10515 [Ramlibacter rhizophilus]
MSTSRSIPRLLQRRDDWHRGEEPWRPESEDGGRMDKGDRRPQDEATKPSKEREVGDLERSEREDHGRAHAGHAHA